MERRHGPLPRFTDELRVAVKPDTKAELGRLAAARELTVSEVVREALDVALDGDDGEMEGVSWDNV